MRSVWGVWSTAQTSELFEKDARFHWHHEGQTVAVASLSARKCLCCNVNLGHFYAAFFFTQWSAPDQRLWCVWLYIWWKLGKFMSTSCLSGAAHTVGLPVTVKPEEVLCSTLIISQKPFSSWRRGWTTLDSGYTSKMFADYSLTTIVVVVVVVGPKGKGQSSITWPRQSGTDLEKKKWVPSFKGKKICCLHNQW